MILITDFNVGVRGRNSYVICSAAEKQIRQVESGRTEWITVIECIYEDGSAISSLMIFKEENIQTTWISSEIDRDWS